MPFTCYSYPADMPSASLSRAVLQAGSRDQRKPGYPSFRYPMMSYPVWPCFRYQADELPAPPGLRRMPGTSTCFRY